VLDGRGWEAQEAQAQRLQEALTFTIDFSLGVVRRAVNLDHKSLTGREEVDYERPERLLAAEPHPLQLAAAQCLPEE
jgi:hypothetical protein